MVILGVRIAIFMCKCAIVSMHGDCTKVHGRGILRGSCALFICVFVLWGHTLRMYKSK